ncbi:MAG: hypothetical protein AAGD00_01085 [Planctomycetota bacterium]
MTRESSKNPGRHAAARVLLCAGLASSASVIGACATEPDTALSYPPPSIRPAQQSDTFMQARPAVVPIQRADRFADAGARPQMVSQVRFPNAPPPTLNGATKPEYAPGELIPVRFATDGAEVSEVVAILVGEFMGKDFVIDPGVSGTISLDIDETMTESQVLELVGRIGSILGFGVSMRGETVYAVRAELLARDDGAPITNVAPAFASPTPAIRIRTLRHIAATDAEKALKEFSSASAKIVPVGRTLVISDTQAQLARMGGLLSALDVPAFAGVEMWSYRLAHINPVAAETLLTELARATALSSASGTDSLVSFVGLSEADRLLVISRDATARSVVQQLVEQIDVPRDSQRRFRWVYNIQHYDPARLRNLLSGFLGDVLGESSGPGPRPAQQNAQRSEALAKIFIDEEERLLLFEGTRHDYEDLMGVLTAVDRPRQQVMIQLISAEVALNDQLQYGVEYFLNAFEEDGLGILDVTGSVGSVADPTGTAFFVGGSGLALVQALQNVSDVAIVQQPDIYVRDGDVGEIQVGGETPVVLADQDSGESDTAIRREIEYRDTGVQLTVTPRISSNQVTLKLRQEINEVGQVTEFGPEFTTRVIDTTVIVPNGQTVVLGGIIDDSDRDTRDKIPGLADIPLIGSAFQSRDIQRQRTELFLAITPTIVAEPEMTAPVLSEFLRSASAVRAALHRFADDLPPGVLYGTAPDQSPPRPLAPANDVPELENGGVPIVPTEVPTQTLRPEGIVPAPQAAQPEAPAQAEQPAGEDEMPSILRMLMQQREQRGQGGDGS